MNPVGQPHVISCAEVIHEIVAGLKSAGLKSKDIVVYDRYRAQFLNAGFDKMLPEGVRWSLCCGRLRQHADGSSTATIPITILDMALVTPGQDLPTRKHDDPTSPSFSVKKSTS